MRCNACKFWDLKEGRDYAGTGLCTKAQPLWEVSEWQQWDRDYDNSDQEKWKRGLKEEFADLKMFVQDGSDYKAIMLTKPDFYCAHFAQR